MKSDTPLFDAIKGKGKKVNLSLCFFYLSTTH